MIFYRTKNYLSIVLVMVLGYLPHNFCGNQFFSPSDQWNQNSWNQNSLNGDSWNQNSWNRDSWNQGSWNQDSWNQDMGMSFDGGGNNFSQNQFDYSNQFDNGNFSNEYSQNYNEYFGGDDFSDLAFGYGENQPYPSFDGGMGAGVLPPFAETPFGGSGPLGGSLGNKKNNSDEKVFSQNTPSYAINQRNQQGGNGRGSGNRNTRKNNNANRKKRIEEMRKAIIKFSTYPQLQNNKKILTALRDLLSRTEKAIKSNNENEIKNIANELRTIKKDAMVAASEKGKKNNKNGRNNNKKNERKREPESKSRTMAKEFINRLAKKSSERKKKGDDAVKKEDAASEAPSKEAPSKEVVTKTEYATSTSGKIEFVKDPSQAAEVVAHDHSKLTLLFGYRPSNARASEKSRVEKVEQVLEKNREKLGYHSCTVLKMNLDQDSAIKEKIGVDEKEDYLLLVLFPSRLLLEKKEGDTAVVIANGKDCVDKNDEKYEKYVSEKLEKFIAEKGAAIEKTESSYKNNK